jgi:TatD DNase family protein
MWADSHCHVPYDGVGVDVLDDARAAGVARVISVGTDAAQSASAVALARQEPDVWATVGLHPHDATEGVASIEPLLADQALRRPGAPVVVAVGECGLDYHYDHSPREVQREVFGAQVDLARRLDLALVIHTRDAWDDTFAVLAERGTPPRTVFHCFTGGAAEARRALEIGAWLSFSGIVTFRSADDVRDAARLCPPDRLLVETDSPYLAPVPHRGRPNRPALVTVVGEAVAAVRSEPVAAVEDATWAATAAAFALPADASAFASRADVPASQADASASRADVPASRTDARASRTDVPAPPAG